ncbi:uncharacterized protein LOC111377832 [Olea europaea var. sylvestris]|uniref:uncharacterized protein LOC111377832 n=1 Tax=Olea europaea var. sylvestris TaxID=158386 RepID=UPI000C1CD1DC|nr:uncharacterized protein LOC111377832 [Olea europaea var. sylvestris]
MKGVLRFGKKGKLQPRFIGPFEILQKVGNAAYRIALPPDLSTVHDVFHVSMLRQYVSDPSHVVNYQPLDIKSNMTYKEKPVSILDRRIQRLRTKEIPSFGAIQYGAFDTGAAPGIRIGWNTR